MPHDGEDLQKSLKEVGISNTLFATRMGIGRNTPARWFDTPNLPQHRLTQAAKALGLPAEAVFSRLQARPVAPTLHPIAVEEPPQRGYTNGDDALQKCTLERARWQQKAYDVMEKYTALLESHTKLLQERLERAMPEPTSASKSRQHRYPLVSQ